MTELATDELARARAARIRAGIQTYLHTLADIAAAYAQADWKALGYKDWQAYIDGEYSEHRLRLTPEHRQKAIAELRLAGMSQRAIGTALGVSVGTVNADLAGVQDRTPAETMGTDGKTYAASRPSQPARPPAEADAQLDAPVAARVREAEDATSKAGEGAGEPAFSPAPQTAVEGPGASPSTDADGEGTTTDPVGVDAAGAPTDLSAAGAPVNPLDDPRQVEIDRRERVSARVAAGLVHLHEALDPDPIAWLCEWMPTAYKGRGAQLVEDALTPTGLRTIAKHLETLADYLDSTDGAL